MSQNNPVVGTMVFCEKCRSVVWAQPNNWGDLRAVCNVLGLPCPECGEHSNFDGYEITESMLRGRGPGGCDVSPWWKMHQIAERDNLEWKNRDGMLWGVRGETRQKLVMVNDTGCLYDECCQYRDGASTSCYGQDWSKLVAEAKAEAG